MTRILTHLDQEVAEAMADFFKNPHEGWWWVNADGTLTLEGVVGEGGPPMVRLADNAGVVIDG